MKPHGTYPRSGSARMPALAFFVVLVLAAALHGGRALAQGQGQPQAAHSASDAGTAAAAPAKVLAAHPVAHALALALTRDSGIVLERAAPAKLPATRMASYFAGRGARQLARMAADADAVIGLRSIWPDDPLYPLARRSNIRVVEIDAARPVDGALPGVALQAGSDAGGYPWLNPVNLGRMADIIAADLERLAPAAKPVLQGNLAALKRGLVALSADAELRFAELDDVSVASLSDRLDYLVSGLNLDMALRDVRADDEWTEEALDELAGQLEDLDVAVVLHHREPAPAIRQAVAAAGGRLVVLDTDQEDPVAQLGNMVQVLKEAFEAGGARDN